MGTAMNMVEYVPTTTPTTSVKEKPRSTSPPKMYRARTARKVVPLEMRVRVSVWLIESLSSFAKLSLRR